MSDRDLETQSYDGNPLLNWTEHAGRLSTAKNVVIIQISKIMPLSLKNKLLRLTGLKIGEETAIGLSVQFDIFFPEKIALGQSTVIGYGTTVLAHETTTDEFRTGETVIGDNVLVGANSTILAGVTIEDDATVAAGSVVTKDVEENSFVAGVPARPVDKTG